MRKSVLRRIRKFFKSELESYQRSIKESPQKLTLHELIDLFIETHVSETVVLDGHLSTDAIAGLRNLLCGLLMSHSLKTTSEDTKKSRNREKKGVVDALIKSHKASFTEKAIHKLWNQVIY